MKQKEIVQLSVAAIVFVVAGILVFTQLGPGKSKSAKSAYTYEDVQSIDASFDENQLQAISDSAKVRDFYIPPDLNAGVGNPSPFKPIN